jgi:hypothetical protein
MKRQYLVIDFECIQPNEWQSVGIVLYERSKDGHSGTILRQFNTACDRVCTSMIPSTREFWRKHYNAFLYNVEEGKTRQVATEEAAICRFITTVKADYPNFYLLSDAPEYDIGLMNDILMRNGCPIMSHRSEKIYFQSICTWSSKKTLDMLGVTIKATDVVGLGQLSASGMLAHTPIFDCMRILNEYFCLLDTIQTINVQ